MSAHIIKSYGRRPNTNWRTVAHPVITKIYATNHCSDWPFWHINTRLSWFVCRGIYHRFVDDLEMYIKTWRQKRYEQDVLDSPLAYYDVVTD